MMLNGKWLPVAIILLTYLAAGILYATLTPKWQAPDEPAHYNYIHYLATQPGFPELTANCYNQPYLEELKARRFPPELPVGGVCYEFHQPPLYYLLAVPLFNLSGGSLLALRLLSVGLGAGVALLAFFIAAQIFPNNRLITLGSIAFVAFVPMHAAILSSVNNDPLAELLLAILLFLLTRRLVNNKTADLKPSGQGYSFRQDALLGFVLGLGLVTKTTVYIAIPLVAAALWLARARGSKLLKQAAIIYGVALLVALPWYLRNVMLYGGVDILGLGRHDEVVVGQPRTADFVAQVGPLAAAGEFILTTFRSFWGQFGWMAAPMDGRTYLFLTLLTLIALAGLVAFITTEFSRPQLLPPQHRALALLGLAVLLTFAAYGGYNLTYKQFQGRYLFPGLIPLGVFFSLGFGEALSLRRAWWLAGGLALALGWTLVAGPGSQPDVRAGLALGLMLAVAVGRLFLPRRWLELTRPALLIAGYAALALLALASPFWFVIPYL